MNYPVSRPTASTRSTHTLAQDHTQSPAQDTADPDMTPIL